MEERWIAALGLSPLFAGIGPGSLRGLFACLGPRVKDYAKGEIVGLAGQTIPGMGLVLAGKLAVVKENDAGERLVVDLLGPGGVFGEMAVFAGRRTWPATVAAQEASAVAFLRPEALLEECARSCPDHRRLIANLLRLLAQKAMVLNKKIEYLTKKTLRAKITTFLLEEMEKSGRAVFPWPLNRNELANFLGVTRPALSRELGRMRDEGVISFDRVRVVIKDPAALRRMVE